MITYQTYLPIVDSKSSSSIAFSSSGSSTQTINAGASSTSFSSSESTFNSNYSTSNSSFTSASTVATESHISRATLIQGTSTVTQSGSSSGGTTQIETHGLSGSGFTVSSTTTQYNEQGTDGTTTGSDSGSVTADSSTGTSTYTTALTTSTQKSTSRSFTSTMTYNTNFTYTGTNTDSNTQTFTSATTSYSTTSGTTSTSFIGSLNTLLTTVTLTRGFDGQDLYYIASIIDFEDYSTKNEWGFSGSASITGSPYDLLSVLATSTTRTHIAFKTTSAGVFISTTSAYTHQFTRNSTALQVQTYHTTTTSASTLSWTNITTFSSLPFPTSSSTSHTEAVTTSRTTTVNAITVGTLGVSETKTATTVQALATTAPISTQIGCTELGTILITYHSSLVSTLTCSTTLLSTRTISTNVNQDVKFNGVFITSSSKTSSGVVGGNESTTTASSFEQGQGRSESLFETRYRFLATQTGSILGELDPEMLQGFRDASTPRYSDTYGSSITVNISNSTRIPFSFFSSEQSIGVSLLMTYPTTTKVVDTTLSETWTVSFSGNSMSLTYSNTSSSFTATSTDAATYLTDSTTVSASMRATGSTSLSNSLQSLSVTTSTTMRAFGGYANVSTLPEIGKLSMAAYLSTNRSRTGGADTTASTFFNRCSTLLETGNSDELHIFDPATVVQALSTSGGTTGGEFASTQKWIY